MRRLPRPTNPFDAADARLAGMIAALLVLATISLFWLAWVLGMAVSIYHGMAG